MNIHGYWGRIRIHIHGISRARIYSYPRIHGDPYRPAGSQNRPMRTNQNNSTRREPSGFEYEAIEEARDRDGNREQGQGGRRGQADRGRGRGSRGRGREQGWDMVNMQVYQAMTGVLEF